MVVIRLAGSDEESDDVGSEDGSSDNSEVDGIEDDSGEFQYEYLRTLLRYIYHINNSFAFVDINSEVDHEENELPTIEDNPIPLKTPTSENDAKKCIS